VRDKGKTAGEIMAHAFSVIDSSEFLFVILASEEKSEGMILEVGYCIAKGIPVIIAVKEGVKNTYLPEMGKKTFVWRDNQDLSAKIAELGV
jgi:nucleoside 2-deoxyribosyltransferase